MGIDDTIRYDELNEVNNSNINIFEGSGFPIAKPLNEKNAIAYSDYFGNNFSMETGKFLKIDGYAPNFYNIRNGYYPIIRPAYYVYHEENLSLAAKEYLNFLKKDIAKDIGLKYGYVYVEED
jgi:ABC-type phosphate transport system substrate-binding protein